MRGVGTPVLMGVGVLGAGEGGVDHRESVWVADVRQQLSREGSEMGLTVEVGCRNSSEAACGSRDHTDLPGSAVVRTWGGAGR